MQINTRSTLTIQERTQTIHPAINTAIRNSERRNFLKKAVAGATILLGLTYFSTLSEEDKASIGQYFTSIPWGVLNGVIALLSLKDFLSEATSLSRSPIQAKTITLAAMAFTLFCLDLCAAISDFPELGYNLSTGENTPIGDITNRINHYNPIVLLMTNLIKAGMDERPLKQLIRDSILFIGQNLINLEINANTDFLSLNGINPDQVGRTQNALYRFLNTNRGDAFFNILMQVITTLSQLPERHREGATQNHLRIHYPYATHTRELNCKKHKCRYE